MYFSVDQFFPKPFCNDKDSTTTKYEFTEIVFLSMNFYWSHWCQLILTLLQACPDGSYSTGAASKCELCPAGYSCDINGNTAICSLGQYSILGNGSCLTCPDGFICQTASSLPQVSLHFISFLIFFAHFDNAYKYFLLQF